MYMVEGKMSSTQSNKIIVSNSSPFTEWIVDKINLSSAFSFDFAASNVIASKKSRTDS